MNIIDLAQKVALEAHHGVSNKHDGEPYVLHLQRVSIAVRDAGGSPEEQALAWLHDVVEDTDVTLLDIVNIFGSEMSQDVDAISKRPGETNEQYYVRCKGRPRAKRVKLCDLHDNFGRNHLIEDDAKRLRMAKKYSFGIDILARTEA